VVQYFHLDGGNFHYNMMVEKSTLSNTTLKGGKIHHPPTKGGKCLIYVNLCTIHGTGIASVVMQLTV